MEVGELPIDRLSDRFGGVATEQRASLHPGPGDEEGERLTVWRDLGSLIRRIEKNGLCRLCLEPRLKPGLETGILVRTAMPIVQARLEGMKTLGAPSPQKPTPFQKRAAANHSP